MVMIAGVEEAGRGPVIGPMVMCGVLVDEKDEIKLKSIGAKDSKLLTPRTREILFDQIKAMVKKYEVVIISAQEIDDALRDPNSNLNKLEAKTSAKILNKLKPDKALLDCPSNNTSAYAAEIRKNLENKKLKLVAEHKADVKYTVVAASSIIAKVTRDREIEKIKESIGIDFGSGYPSDEKTQLFLKKNWSRFPEIFRQTWASYKNVAKAKEQKQLGEF
ncbi:ribonuclease HII [Candidatus Woesearchaeota archaeon]|nr:ribonuclease HII [Candidatus Woesearchaeota archaeon]